jgi:membrane protein YdbS with pleckstrin-like domain
MIAPDHVVQRASRWCYQGVWGVITGWLLVPEDPPQLQGADDRQVHSFRPSEGYLRYLKLFFWIGLTLIDGLLLILWLALCLGNIVVGMILAPLVFAIMILPDIIAYIAIHLRYDSTWYVLSDRSMRIRRGIWVIHETTITYDNIQNVAIQQGPIQRYFGIANVLVETAGGGAGSGHGDGGTSVGHHGLLEGIDNAVEVRDLILSKWRSSGSSGLGDDADHLEPKQVASTGAEATGFTHQEITLLEQIRDLVVAMSTK